MLVARAYAIVEKDGDHLNILQTPNTKKMCFYTSRGRAEAQLKSTTRRYPSYEEVRDYPEDAFVLELKGEIDA
jgi:hypothetical protein